MSIVRSKPVASPERSQTNSNSVAVRGYISNSPRSIVNITLKYTPSLEKELIDAFRKDQEKAIHEVEQRKEGKVSHMLYRFDDSEYSFTIKNDTINIRATEGSQPLLVYPDMVARSIKAATDGRQKITVGDLTLIADSIAFNENKMSILLHPSITSSQRDSIKKFVEDRINSFVLDSLKRSRSNTP